MGSNLPIFISSWKKFIRMNLRGRNLRWMRFRLCLWNILRVILLCSLDMRKYLRDGLLSMWNERDIYKIIMYKN